MQTPCLCDWGLLCVVYRNVIGLGVLLSKRSYNYTTPAKSIIQKDLSDRPIQMEHEHPSSRKSHAKEKAHLSIFAPIIKIITPRTKRMPPPVLSHPHRARRRRVPPGPASPAMPMRAFPAARGTVHARVVACFCGAISRWVGASRCIG